MARWNRILVGKIDLDTVGAAYLLGVTREDNVMALRVNASDQDLADSSVLCIEVGGSGQVKLGNFDHHEAGGPTDSATKQAYAYVGVENQKVAKLVEYIHCLDTEGLKALGQTETNFPSLSDVFSGMLLTERDQKEQLHKGIEILQTIMQKEINPFGKVEGFDSYAKAKAENKRQIAKAVEQAQWATTKAGKKFAYLETEFFGAPGALYGAGAEIVVAFNPQFGTPPIRKFTIAGNGTRVDAVLSKLNTRFEKGWGGPPTGTILGSPKRGSRRALKSVVKIVKETL